MLIFLVEAKFINSGKYRNNLRGLNSAIERRLALLKTEGFFRIGGFYHEFSILLLQSVVRWGVMLVHER